MCLDNVMKWSWVRSLVSGFSGSFHALVCFGWGPLVCLRLVSSSTRFFLKRNLDKLTLLKVS